MKKLIFLDDKAKKLVISVTILAFVGVIAMSMFMGCTGEATDRAKDETGRIIDTTDKADDISNEIEDIIGEAPPKEAAGAVSDVMMINPFPLPLQRPGHMEPQHIIELPYGSGSTGIFENACWNGCA